MAKEVLIQINSAQILEDGADDSMSFFTKGNLYNRCGVYYILYKDTQVSGMEDVTTSLKVERAKVTLNRMGSVDHKLTFEEGVLHGSAYVTPHGTLFLEVLTEKMEISLTEEGGHISLKYNLFSQEQLLSQNTLEIIIKEDAPQ
ncbi:MAG: DUF1934 domain-containing protein [Desulfitobacterium sp.]|mgnify:CR=1 FL=1|nr:DUF1934 domain-containing protein [Desulfitobacterium sp.]